MVVLSFVTYHPLIGGLSFLEKVPDSFICTLDQADEWDTCTRTEICEAGLSRSQYKPTGSYIDNWIDRLDMLCVPNLKVGMLGSCFFIGIIISIIPVPALSDRYGRRSIYLATMALTVTA